MNFRKQLSIKFFYIFPTLYLVVGLNFWFSETELSTIGIINSRQNRLETDICENQELTLNLSNIFP